MCKITDEQIKKFNGCNKKELESVLRDNNISYEEISDHVIGFDFGHLMEEVYALPKIVISKLADYLNDHHIDIDGIFYYETKNEDGATNKDDFQNIKNSSLIALSNIKYDLKNYWKMSTLSVFFSENNSSRVSNILSGRVKWNSEDEYDNILFFKTGKGTYHPSINERYLINVDLFNKVSDNIQKEICKKVGMPSFILEKILYDDMPVNLTACDLLLNSYNEILSTSFKLKDFCKEKEISVDEKKPVSDSKPAKRKYSSRKIVRKYSCNNIPQEVIDRFPDIINGTISKIALSKKTGIPYSTISRMITKMKDDKDHYLSLVDNAVKIVPSNSIEYNKKENKIEENKSEAICPVYFDDSLKNYYSGIDLSIFSKYNQEYLRSVSDYLIKLADLKDAAEKSKNIAIKVNGER